MTIKEREREFERYLYSFIQKWRRLKSMKKRLENTVCGVGVGTGFVVWGGGLTKQQEEEIIKYYKPYVSLKETMGHEWYTKMTGNYFVNYIPDWLWFAYIDPFYNDVDMGPKMGNKCFFENMFPGCAQPVNLGCRANGIWYTNTRGVMSYESLMQTISKEKVLFVKQANNSCGGHGVIKVDGDDVVGKVTEIVNNISKDIVIQKAIQQSEVLNSINSSSVNSIRVLSLLRPEGVKIYSMLLRVGIHGTYVDNASSGGLIVGINSDGRLKERAFNLNGDSCVVHPSTGVRFGEVILPNIQGVKDLVKSIHPQIPYFRLVSWDIVLDKNNQPLLLEANLREGGIQIHQLTNGPVFGEDTLAILKEVFRRT